MRSIPAVAILLLALAACGLEAKQTAAEATPPKSTAGTSTTTGSCVEQYTIENLKKRDYAFDGTVRSIQPGTEGDPDFVVFDVSKWYKGGQGSSVTLRAYGFTAVTSAGGSPHSVGDHLLVAGDDDFVWECGFTQSYSESLAAEWENALG
jgi:hypothetical protein